MNLFFTALLVLARFNPLLPGYNDFQTSTKAQLVKSYSAACLAFQSQELRGVPNLAEGLQAFLKNQDHKLEIDEDVVNVKRKPTVGEIDRRQIVELYPKLCRQDPDLTALDQYDTELKSAAVKYQELIDGLPAIGNVRELHLAQSTDITAADGTTINEIYKNGARRKVISLKDMPSFLPGSFVALEDHRFYEHHGVDEFGILRAFLKGSSPDKRPEGGSTITQQVAKNLFLDDSLSIERKLKEILIAEKLEGQLSKTEILQLYLNLIYFGQNSWGIEKAAETYFGKKAANLTVFETAYLAGIVQGPNLYQYKDSRTEARVNLVLEKMFEQKLIPSLLTVDMNKDLKFVDNTEKTESDYFRDFVAEKLTIGKVSDWDSRGPKLATTLNTQLQKSSQDALRDGLINYERAAGRYIFKGPVVNIANYLSIRKENLQTDSETQALLKAKAAEGSFSSVGVGPISKVEPPSPDANLPYWLKTLRQVRVRYTMPVESWTFGVVLDGDSGKIGTLDGNEIILSGANRKWAKNLTFGDVVYLKRAGARRLEIIQPPEVNGAVVAMDPQTGQILAMVGGFSYRMSQYNRATLASRQPGSLIKPFTYMAALQKGLQPNLRLKDENIQFDPSAPGGQKWIPRDYDPDKVEPHTMRWALEQSRNIMTADLLSYVGLDPIRKLTQVFGLYENPITNYPFILGAQETNLLTLVKAYCAIANGGYLIAPQYLSSQPVDKKKIDAADVDDITLFQIRSFMQGVLARGTAMAISDLAPNVAGKTGTTEDLRDAWFIGFTPHIVVGVFVGYDQPKTDLGKGFSGAVVALPIAEKILRQSFTFYHDKEEFPPPPPGVTSFPTDQVTGEVKDAGAPGTVLEYYRASVFNLQQKVQ